MKLDFKKLFMFELIRTSKFLRLFWDWSPLLGLLANVTLLLSSSWIAELMAHQARELMRRGESARVGMEMWEPAWAQAVLVVFMIPACVWFPTLILGIGLFVIALYKIEIVGCRGLGMVILRSLGSASFLCIAIFSFWLAFELMRY